MMHIEKLQKLRVLLMIVAGMILVLVLRLGWMQLIEGPQYKEFAESNRIRKIASPAPRGIIYDRHGAVLVSNRPSFAVSIIPSEYTRAVEATPVLAGITGVPAAEIESSLERNRAMPYSPIRLKRDADEVMITKIQERKNDLPGVIIEAVPVRHYLYNELAAQVLGYVGNISEEEYGEYKQQGYGPNELIGKSGLEKEWEQVLRGREGGRAVEVNVQGEEVNMLGEEAATPGEAIVTTLDANLQKAAEESLAAQVERSRKSGAPAQGGCVVVLNVQNGEVLAMASYPAFNPNLFTDGISYQEWERLATDVRNPLANKVIQNAYPPGSVFKIVTAAAALDTGQTKADEVFIDKGVYIYHGWSFYGWDIKGLGKLDIVGAIAWSSDPVFYELGRRLGVDRLADYARTFGFGQTTGIKLAGEVQGVVPTVAWKEERFQQPWYEGETLIAAIGQGYYLATPLQQAMLLMAVANRGVMYRPQLVKQVLAQDGSVAQEFPAEILRTVYLQPAHWELIRQGLQQVTAGGTGAAVFRDFQPTVAGKSGSAETGKGTTHSWFACYAPADRPEIAVAVLVEEGGEGSVAAAPVVREVLQAYFKAAKP
ncbi:putative membrane protein [Propionispora sp. 2/2-37]|uniref:penicillin-binding protein 2 n=1 Tax=Propionispora sp. 2/2-37 TaxID=1677858 RepID=UPI0006BB8742|nr:penicillin-binding protein 2 [Propionispora sp. 2/2-37]CUH95743.1 putative membrane protein [Propionispora sp. 2/2-37]